MLNLIFEVLCAKIKVDAFIIIMKELKGSLLNIFDFFFYIYIWGELFHGLSTSYTHYWVLIQVLGVTAVTRFLVTLTSENERCRD